MIQSKTSLTAVILLSILLTAGRHYAQQLEYPRLSQSYDVITGDSGKWDFNKTHTLSIVEANKDGYKYWGYYALSYYGGDQALRRCGLARSNDLVHWEKYQGNPIIGRDCRWPTVVLVNSVFYMFYAEYDDNNDSRIVMLSSTDGIHFSGKTEIVPREVGTQNQNPFIYFNKQDKCFYLAYYHGVERSNDKPLVGREKIDRKTNFAKTGKNFWQIRLLKSKSVQLLNTAKPKILLSSDHTVAAPSIAFYKGKYFLLVESICENKWDNKWVTLAYGSSRVDGGYKLLKNNPVLPDNDACAFQYMLNDQLYITYSHCLDIVKWNWVIKMVKVQQ